MKVRGRMINFVTIFKHTPNLSVEKLEWKGGSPKHCWMTTDEYIVFAPVLLNGRAMTELV